MRSGRYGTTPQHEGKKRPTKKLEPRPQKKAGRDALADVFLRQEIRSHFTGSRSVVRPPITRVGRSLSSHQPSNPGRNRSPEAPDRRRVLAGAAPPCTRTPRSSKASYRRIIRARSAGWTERRDHRRSPRDRIRGFSRDQSRGMGRSPTRDPSAVLSDGAAATPDDRATGLEARGTKSSTPSERRNLGGCRTSAPCS
jgi:hypothetical protein